MCPYWKCTHKRSFQYTTKNLHRAAHFKKKKSQSLMFPAVTSSVLSAGHVTNVTTTAVCLNDSTPESRLSLIVTAAVEWGLWNSLWRLGCRIPEELRPQPCQGDLRRNQRCTGHRRSPRRAAAVSENCRRRDCRGRQGTPCCRTWSQSESVSDEGSPTKPAAHLHFDKWCLSGEEYGTHCLFSEQNVFSHWTRPLPWRVFWSFPSRPPLAPSKE